MISHNIQSRIREIYHTDFLPDDVLQDIYYIYQFKGKAPLLEKKHTETVPQEEKIDIDLGTLQEIHKLFSLIKERFPRSDAIRIKEPIYKTDLVLRTLDQYRQYVLESVPTDKKTTYGLLSKKISPLYQYRLDEELEDDQKDLTQEEKADQKDICLILEDASWDLTKSFSERRKALIKIFNEIQKNYHLQSVFPVGKRNENFSKQDHRYYSYAILQDQYTFNQYKLILLAELAKRPDCHKTYNRVFAVANALKELNEAADPEKYNADTYNDKLKIFESHATNAHLSPRARMAGKIVTTQAFRYGAVVGLAALLLLATGAGFPPVLLLGVPAIIWFGINIVNLVKLDCDNIKGTKKQMVWGNSFFFSNAEVATMDSNFAGNKITQQIYKLGK